MTSQFHRMIPFTVSQSQQQFRLLELPPELVEVISAQNAPILEFKSASTIESSDAPITPASKTQTNLHLVTRDNSFQVRQVNTSNSVYISEPSTRRLRSALNNSLENGDENTDATEKFNVTSAHLSAVAEVSSLLELLPTSYNVHALLRKRLHLWTGAHIHGQPREPLASLTKGSLFSDIPCPAYDLVQAWKDLGAIETTFAGYTVCMRPTAVAARDMWEGLLQCCVAEGVDLSANISFERILKAYEPRLDSGEKVVEVEILSAMLECLEEPTTVGFRLNREKTVRWVGTKILQAACDEKSSWSLGIDKPQEMEVAEFLASWREMLPEVWRGDAQLPGLGPQRYDRYQVVENRKTIQFWEGVGDERFVFNSAKIEELGDVEAAVKSTNSAAGKRKWHEKFKAGRDKRAK